MLANRFAFLKMELQKKKKIFQIKSQWLQPNKEHRLGLHAESRVLHHRNILSYEEIQMWAGNKIKITQGQICGPWKSCIPPANKTSAAWASVGLGSVFPTLKSKKWACVGCLPCMYDCPCPFQSCDEIITLLSQPLISQSPFPMLLRYPMS